MKETALRTVQLAQAHGQPCAIRNPQAIAHIERKHRVPKREDLRWLALVLRLPLEQVEATAQAQAGMLAAERAARARAKAAERIAALTGQAPLPDGWPLAELVAGRRAELGLSQERLALRMREAAARGQHGSQQPVRTNSTTIFAVERERCIPQPPTLRLLALALRLPLEQVEAAAEQQRRKRKLEHIMRSQADAATTAESMVGTVAA